MPELIVHIGTHKTGSTAIQHALRANVESLAREGIILVYLPPATLPLIRATAVDSTIVEALAAQWQNALRQSPDAKRLVLSWEGFSGETLLGYANAPIVAETLAFATKGIATRIVVYLRRQDDFLESIYTQKIHGGESYSFADFLGRFDRTAFDWQALLATFAKHFAGMTVRRYHKHYLPTSDSILSDFNAIIGSQCLTAQASAEQPNAGYSRDTLEIARLTNPYLNDADKRQLRRILQQVGAKQAFEHYSYFDTASRREFLERYQDSNAAVARDYFADPTGELFPPESSHEEAAYGGLKIESAAILFMKAVLFLHAEHEQQIHAVPKATAAPAVVAEVERSLILRGIRKGERLTRVAAAKIPGLGWLNRHAG